MELLDRYLESVRKYLPFERQDDIVAELRANLEAQLEEKEEALGRPLTPAEAEAWICQFGSPIQMAAPYQSQHYLIGPAIFPFYRHVLKLTCTWVMLIYAIVSVATIAVVSQPTTASLVGALLRLPGVLFTLAAWITLVFALLEFGVTHGHIAPEKLGPLAKGWSPTTLPPLSASAPSRKKQKSFAQAVTEAVFGVFLLGWLLLIPHHPWLLMGPGAVVLDTSPYQLAPVWWQFYWAIVALNAVQLAWNIENLLRDKWRRPHPVKKIAFKFLGIIPLVFVLAARDRMLIVLKNPALDQARYGASLDTINHYVYIGFEVIAAIVTIQLLWDFYELSRNHYRNRAAAL